MTADSRRIPDVQAAVGDRYEITSLLRAGGRGVVYAGRDRTANTRVAITVLGPEVAATAGLAARFRREAAQVAHLPHPHIVPVLEFDIRADLAFVVTPIVDGVTLDVYVAGHGRLSLGEASELLRQVGSALAFAHSRGVVHGGVRPSSIQRERTTGRWRLADFGMTHREAEAGAPTTPDAQADLTALAATVVYGLTGAEAALTGDRAGLARTLRAARPDLTTAVVRAISAPLALEPDGVPGTVDDWIDLVRAAERYRPVKPWAAVVALLVAAVGGWWAISRQPEAVTAARPTVAVLPFTLTGSAPAVPLDAVLPQAFAWQLQMLPQYRVLGAPVMMAAVHRRFGGEPQSEDTLTALARQLGADVVVAGQAETSNGQITIHIRVSDLRRRRTIAAADTSGPLDSLDVLVSSLVARGFASRLAREVPGSTAPSLPRGITAIAAYFQGDQDLRHAQYRSAVEQFTRVISLDSAYAPAYLKRVLALIQLVPTEDEIRSALPSLAYKDRLDPVSRDLLTGYEKLINDGDVLEAERIFRRLLNDFPDAVDGWFALGELQFHFGTLMGIPLSESRAAFQEVLHRDPSYATAVAHLLMLALAEGDEPTARQYFRRYVEIDSTSVVAELVGAGDTLLHHAPLAPRVLASFPRRSREFLDNVAFISSEFGRSAPERVVGGKALDAIWGRASRGDERARAFRMRLAGLLGSGRYATALRFFRGARSAGVPQGEVDRWMVLSGVTPLPDFGDDSSQAAAVRRLTGADDDQLMARWLVARWFARRDADRAQDALADLKRIVHPPGSASPLELSLLDDLTAMDFLASGDTAGALATWRRATQRFSVEQVPFSLVASLWPLRAGRVRIASLTGRYREALDASATFLRVAAFVDQAVWPEIMPLRAEAALAQGDTVLAINTYVELLQILEMADGDGLLVRERALQALDDLKTRWKVTPGDSGAVERPAATAG
ncbi:MAG: tetratricopeptide repeat protein [Gemmatimonadetes bacterium]|nr:tetratricopeptide repeat protein [Gemmatimonadota bacterium]